MVGVEAHRLPDPLDPVLGPAEPGEQFALLDQDQVVVRVERQAALLVVGGLVVVAVRQAHRREDAVDVAVVVVERQGYAELGHHLVPGRARGPRTSR